MSIEWPLNEPIPTYGGGEAFVYHICDGGPMYGRIGECAAKWTIDGICTAMPEETNKFDLIPPKREPRTQTIWVDWTPEFSVIWVGDETPTGGATKYTLTHPDDRQPITAQDLADIVSGHSYPEHRVKALQALLKERGYE